MTFVYQPVIIKTLLENGGRVSVRDLARECLAYDEAQVEYYIRTVKRYPREVLTKHGVIDFDRKGQGKRIKNTEATGQEKNRRVPP